YPGRGGSAQDFGPEGNPVPDCDEHYEQAAFGDSGQNERARTPVANRATHYGSDHRTRLSPEPRNYSLFSHAQTFVAGGFNGNRVRGELAASGARGRYRRRSFL